MDWSTTARVRTISRASGLTMRSTYRCRTRASASASPCHFSGSGRSALLVSAQAVGEHGELAALGADDFALDADVVAEVDVGLPCSK